MVINLIEFGDGIVSTAFCYSYCHQIENVEDEVDNGDRVTTALRIHWIEMIVPCRMKIGRHRSLFIDENPNAIKSIGAHFTKAAAVSTQF